MKKGIEFSIGMIVTLILTILVFSLSLHFVFKWFGEAESIKGEIDRQTRDQIVSALKTGTQKVVIPLAIQEVKRGTRATFGLGVRNVLETRDFSVSVAFSGAYAPDGRVISPDAQYVNERWLGNFAVVDKFSLAKNEQKLIPLVIRADNSIALGKSTQKGDYVFNVCVWEGAPRACEPSRVHDTYPGKIFQITLRVL